MTSADPFDASVRIARASKSPMERAAAGLDPVRYRIFCAAYASMRVIDDFVDDDFLAGAPDVRARERAAAQATVRQWRDAAVAALELGAAPAPDDRFRETQIGLAAIQPLASLDPDPWRRLAGAMSRDVAEAPMADWPAFLDYAEGASAAPAAVFVDILGLTPGPDGRLRSRLPGAAVDRIRNSAILLYLVHIMRDLAADAAKGDVLLTLPATLFQELGHDGEGFAAAVRDDPDLLAAARARIADYAGRFLLPALGELAALDQALDPADAAILRGLCEPYIARYEEFAADL